jgi:hypothetical protein
MSWKSYPALRIDGQQTAHELISGKIDCKGRRIPDESDTETLENAMANTTFTVYLSNTVDGSLAQNASPPVTRLALEKKSRQKFSRTSHTATVQNNVR